MATPSSAETRIIKVTGNNTAGVIYGLGWLGAVIYFIQHAPSFWGAILGILEAVIWPILLVYKALEFFHL
jgi:hypothetical protein